MSAMLRANLMLFRLLAFVLALSTLEHCIARRERQQCNPSFCGTIANISYPFRLKGVDPPWCGLPRYELVCENNQPTLYLQNGKFYVKEIFYDNQTIRVVDATLNEDKCSIISLSPLILDAFCHVSNQNPYRWPAFTTGAMYFLKCTTQINSSRYLDVSPCTNTSSSPNTYSYVLYGDYISLDDFHESCIIESIIPFSRNYNFTAHSAFDIYNELLMGFPLSWNCLGYKFKIPFGRRFLWFEINFLRGYQQGGFFYGLRVAFPNLTSFQIALVGTIGLIMVRTLLGIFCLIALVIYKCRRRHLSMDHTIEEFLQSHNNLMPIRYSYSDIKRMTHGFKDKLGQGGFGSVFKGKLRSGHLVAIKLLGNSKAKGLDFINEVATIGRIHHFNVVRLIGFCVDGSKQALVYDFMPNGSLDRIIFSRETNINLSWEKMYEVVLGVARGIEYLHKGCDMQILHFDIKPHNILLDENFIPKVSDFGLAKLCPTDESIVFLTAVRGTRGYIAPELFYKNIGGISYKADVYSFGMLLMEMVGRRKNLNPSVEQLSQIYFPSWVYDRFDQGEEIELGDCTEGEKKIVRKMLIVAFWCIQMKPIDRPSMTKVLEMLQGEVDELLEMPPKPFLHPQETSIEGHQNHNLLITELSNDTSTISGR